MSKRRKVTPVTLTPAQRQRLEHLWFYYGNYGPQTTPGNHNFIQRLIENGIDERPLHTRRTPKSEIPTAECVAAVEAILALDSTAQSGDEERKGSHLRVIRSTEERRRPEVDPEMKALLKDMERRSRVMRERVEETDETPDAA